MFGWKLGGFPVFQIVPIVFLLSENKNEKSLASSCLHPPFRYLHTLMKFPWPESSVLQAEQSLPSQPLLMSNVPILSASLWPFSGLPVSFLQAAYSLLQISCHLSFISCLSGWTTFKLGGVPWKMNSLLDLITWAINASVGPDPPTPLTKSPNTPAGKPGLL